MKGSALKINGRAVAEAADDVRVAHAVECHGLVTEVLDERALKLRVGHAL